MPANVDGMVREGISAYRAGRKDEARALLMRAAEIDQYNEQAWLWLSAVVDSVDEQRTCLENVMTINPNNERAKQGLALLVQKGKPASTQAEDVLAESSFTPLPKANPFSAEPEEELPTTIEWEAPTATSSPSSSRPVAEPSKQEYDDWLNNLGLAGGAKPKTSLQQDAEKFMAMPEHEEEEEDLFGINAALDAAGDDPFASGPFSAAATPIPGAEGKAAPPKSAAKSSMKSPDDLLDDLEDDDGAGAFVGNSDYAQMEKLEASEFFRYIPKEIAATRLPGTREGYGVVLLLGLILMIAVNMGAVAFLVMRLTSA